MKITKDDMWASIMVIAMQRNISLKRLALDCGFNPTTLAPVRHARNWPSTRTIARICTALKMPLTEWATIVAAVQEARAEIEEEQNVVVVKIKRKLGVK